MPKTQTPSTARLEARIPHELHALLKRAAAIQGRTMTDFVIATVEKAAKKTVEDADIMRLSMEDQKRFAEALMNPPEPEPAFKRAAQRHAKLISNSK